MPSDGPLIKTISIDPLPVTSSGVFEGLCNICTTSDCPYRVEMRCVSVFGIEKKMRLYMQGDRPMLVVQCELFTP